MSDPLLQVRGLSRSYQGVTAVDDVTITLHEGIVAGLVGPNGAGKTTLFNLVSGFVRPDSGEIWWRGKDITFSSVPRRARLGLVRTFQHVKVFPGLSVDDNLALAHAAAKRGGRRPAAASELLEVLALGGRHAHLAGRLSYGSARKLSLGLALMLQPDLLMLDEPAAGLTSTELDDLVVVLNSLRDRTTLWIVEHDMQFIAQCCDRVLVLDAGKCIADTAPGLLASHPQVVEAYLGAGQ